MADSKDRDHEVASSDSSSLVVTSDRDDLEQYAPRDTVDITQMEAPMPMPGPQEETECNESPNENESEANIPVFRPFSREELAIIEKRIREKKIAAKKREERRARNIAEYGDSARARKMYEQDTDSEEEEELEPNPKLEQGNDLPRRFGEFPLELASTPICDIDPYFHDKKTFIVISKGGTIFRFSAEKALFLLSPFHPIRRIAIYVLTHPMFSAVIITTILVNCYVMVKPDTEYSSATEIIFAAIYTYESAIKLFARGFFLTKFTYLRDVWNWLDFAVIGMSYVTLTIDLGSFSSLRTFRVFRALKSVAVIPGLKTIVSAIIYSVKNLRDVIILTIFVLAIFALLGLQIYMGVLSQKCVINFPYNHSEDLGMWGNLSHESWHAWVTNESSWYINPMTDNYVMCGNASGAGTCPEGTTCLQGFGPNPNYGFTSFDTFLSAYLCAFRLMTQDFWENLFQITLRTAGPGHVVFFMLNIFLGSFYLINLILAIVAMSYDELQRQAEEEAQRELEELEAIKEAEEAALAEAEAAAAEAAEAMGEIFGFGPSAGKSNNDQNHPDDDDDLPPPFTSERASMDTDDQGSRIIDIVGRKKHSCTSHESLCSNGAKYVVRPESSRSNSDFFNGVGGATAGASGVDRMSIRSSASFAAYNDHAKNNNNVECADKASSSIAQQLNNTDAGSQSSRIGSYPASPSARRASKSYSFGSHVRLHEKYASGSKKPMVLFTYLDAQEHLPYADDSAAVTPKSANGYIVVDTPTRAARKSSYTSHTGKMDDYSYDSHTDLRYPAGSKESIIRKRMATLFSEKSSSAVPTSTTSSVLVDPSGSQSQYSGPSRRAPMLGQLQKNPEGSSNFGGGGEDSIDLQDVKVLHDIIDQVSEQPLSKSTLAAAATTGNGVNGFSGFVVNDVDLDSDDDEGPKVKEKIASALVKSTNVLCIWDCCWLWIKVSELCAFIVFDAFTELFITLCIIVNVIFMGLDRYDIEHYDTKGMSPLFRSVLDYGNYFFTAVFAVEAFVKLAAMSPRYFFVDGWNCFDFLIVVLSLVELLADGISGLSMLRSFRLLRVFKLAKSWKSLNDILTIMANTIGALSNLTFVLCIIIFIFAVMGMQLFGSDYVDKVCEKWDCVMPRWNFIDFMHSFMIVFRVLCGEWIESMWDCMYVAGAACVPYFLATVLVGNLVILNLFLALLLSSFSDMGGGGEEDDGEPDKMAIASQRISRFRKWIVRKISGFFSGLKSRTIGAIRGRRGARTNGGVGAIDGNDIELMEEKDFQGENGDLKNRLKVEINHIPFGCSGESLGEKPKVFDNVPDSSIGEGMDISIQGANGHVKVREKSQENASLRSLSMDKLDVDMSIGRGMDISIRGEGSGSEAPIVKDGRSLEDSNWAVDDEDLNDIISFSKKDLGDDDDFIIRNEEELNGLKNVEEVLYDPVDDVVVERCCPQACYDACPCCIGDPEDSPFWALWYKHRLQVSRLVENQYFETVVLALILLSSFVMTLEDIWFDTRPFLVDTLYYLDRILTVVFFLETTLKLFAMGGVVYFGNAWCWLDFVIVAVSLINFGASLLGANNIPIFKTMRTLRALRPLRAMAKMEGMKVVVNALVGALPSIFNVLLVCIIFWLIFAIIGVNLFMGKFYKCVDTETGERFSHEVIPNRTVCLREKPTGTEWKNSKITFDNVGMAYLALLQVATFKGWIDIMNDAIDSVAIGKQPHREVNIMMYLYFVFFILFGSFFTLNLLVGVIIDKFNEQKNKGGSSLDAFMTEDQKKYIAAMKKASTKKPVKALPRPTWKPQAIMFSIITNKKFDMIIMGFIGLNMVTMMCDHYNMSAEWNFALDNLNLSFIVIFTAEMLVKMFALRYHYFAEPWNLFDFVVVLLSLAGLFLSDLIEKYFVSPTLLRVVRVAKVGRVLRLIKGAKGIRTLLFSLVMAFPALVNICLLLFLVMFICAVFGMSLFKNVKIRFGFDDVHNFQTFGKTFSLLFQMCTSAGWSDALMAITNEEKGTCHHANENLGIVGNCGNFMTGTAFLVLYLVLSFLIIVNMYIAVILENYSQASEDVQQGITDEDYDLFYEIWQEFDPDGTQYMPYKHLSEFLDVLEPPLQIPKPNRFKIIHMDIPIVRYTTPEGEVKENMVFCADILDALTQDFFARKGNPIEEPPHVDEIKVATFKDRPGYQRVSSTLWKQREEYCASLIQKAWKVHKLRNTENNTGDEDEEVTNSRRVIEVQEAKKGSKDNSPDEEDKGGKGGSKKEKKMFPLPLPLPLPK